MIWFTLILLIIILFIFLGIKSKNIDYKAGFFTVSAMMIVPIIAMSICSYQIKYIETPITIENYYSLKQNIEYNRNNFSDFERVQLINKIDEFNKIISENKIKSKNLWYNMWYSKEIGELLYLK